MNRTIIILIVAVCVCALVLVGINRWRSDDTPPPLPSVTDSIDSGINQTPPAPAPEVVPPAPAPVEPIVRPESPAPLNGVSMPAAPETPTPAPHQAPSSVPAPTPELAPVPAPAPIPAPAPAPAPAPTPAPRVEPPAPVAPAPVPPQSPDERKGSAEARIKFDGQTVIVAVIASEPFEYTTMLLPGPDRLVVDLIGCWKLAAPSVPHNFVVSAVRVGFNNGKTRIVLDLKQKPVEHEVRRIGPAEIEIRVR